MTLDLKKLPPEIAARHRALRSLQRRADLEGVDCHLSAPTALYWPTHCPALGIPISTLPKGRRGMHNDSAALERLDHREGYTRANTRVVSGKFKRVRRGRDLQTLDVMAKRTREKAEELMRQAEEYEAMVAWLEKELGV